MSNIANAQRGIGFWLREPLLLGLGALPGTLLLVLPLVALGLRDPWTKPLAALSVLGVIGLWRAPFQDPANVSSKTVLTSVLLTCGLIAILPLSGAVVVGMFKHPSFRVTTIGEIKHAFSLRDLRGLESGLLFLWCLFGPTFCALYFLIHQAIARLRQVKHSRDQERSILGETRN